MYIPKHFEEPGVDAMHELIRAHPLATLVTLSADGLNANHIPLYLSAASSSFGILQGHVARANPVLQDFASNAGVLAIFHGPQCYITPSWYATKVETGKVVPTWNYVVVHAHGQVHIRDDAAWLRSQLEALTNHNEAAFAEPWAVSDAPQEFTQKLIGNIVGFEIDITNLLGKWKVSQNQPEANRAGVIAGLEDNGSKDASSMAALVAGRLKNPR